MVAAGLAQTVEHSSVGPVRCVGPAVKFSMAENRVRGPPPALGQHRWSTSPLSALHCTVQRLGVAGSAGLQCGAGGGAGQGGGHTGGHGAHGAVVKAVTLDG